MATKLNLEPNNKERILWIKLSTSQKLTRRCHTVHSIARDKIFITVLIVPKVVPPLQNLPCTSHQQVLHLIGLQLAHPITENENFEISMLISADYYWSFVQDHIVRGNGPTAVESRLGYLLSGPLSTCPQNPTASI